MLWRSEFPESLENVLSIEGARFNFVFDYRGRTVPDHYFAAARLTEALNANPLVGAKIFRTLFKGRALHIRTACNPPLNN
jgi:hypothetical protein